MYQVQLPSFSSTESSGKFVVIGVSVGGGVGALILGLIVLVLFRRQKTKNSKKKASLSAVSRDAELEVREHKPVSEWKNELPVCHEGKFVPEVHELS